MTKEVLPLYREPVQLNAQLHRHKKLKPYDNVGALVHTHAVFVNAIEFSQAALAFPIIFVQPTPSNPQISPVALLGLVPNDNLFVDEGRWDAAYLPAYFRRMPYFTSPLPGSDQIGVYIDAQWPGLNDAEGEALFTADGEQAPALLQAIEFLKAFDDEAKRTAQFCDQLQSLRLFTDMKADVTLPNGENLTVDGFMTVDEGKLGKLSDASVLALHRSGALGLVHAHLLSLNHMAGLIERHARRQVG
ncbi:MAG: SapC family protein [Ideonella sp.]